MSQTVICPQCRQVDLARKVSAIVDEGISVIHSSGIAPIQTKDRTYWVPVQKEGVSRTKLSQKLAFPPPNIDKALDAIAPKPSGSWWTVIFQLVIAPIIGFFVVYYITGSGLIAFLIGPVAGAMSFWVIWQYLPGRKQRSEIGRSQLYQRKQAYDSAKAKWERLYYCGRCDMVFDPTTNKYAPSDEMGEFLFKA